MLAGQLEAKERIRCGGRRSDVSRRRVQGLVVAMFRENEFNNLAKRKQREDGLKIWLRGVKPKRPGVGAPAHGTGETGMELSPKGLILR